MKTCRTLFALLFWICLAATPVAAQTPEEIVRWIYQSMTLSQDARHSGLQFLTAPERRRTYLSQRLVRLYDANDLNSDHGRDLMNACFEQGFEIPGNDFDAAEVARTLRLSATGNTTGQRVTARFSTFGTPAQIHYDFIVEDGFWRIDDIGEPGWTLSGVSCAPSPPVPPGGAGYCYRAGEDDLRIYVAADGSARFRLESWQSHGHSCFAEGRALPVEGGWLFQDNVEGRHCRLELRVTPQGDIRLSDPDHGCKMTMCGQRAVLDGLTYGRDVQVDCATLPPPPQY